MAPSTLVISDEELLNSYKDAFSLFDKDNSGTITIPELRDVMHSLGRSPTDAELVAILQEIDIDHNGTIEFDEFINLMSRNHPSLSPQLAGTPQGEDPELYGAFKVFDKDGSGKISVEELAAVMKSLGEKLTQEELETMIAEADLDGDKEINFMEFKKMVGGLSK